MEEEKKTRKWFGGKKPQSQEEKLEGMDKPMSSLQRYFTFIMKDKKEYKKRRKEFAVQATPTLIEGCGGIKNISKVTGSGMVLTIDFKSKYLLKPDRIRAAGGVKMKIDRHQITDIYDYMEVKTIVYELKRKMRESKMTLVAQNFS